MPVITNAYVKNIMNRRISEVLKPSPDAKEKKRIKVALGSECVFCGKTLGQAKGDTHFDHLVAASAGGSNSLSNIVIACSDCNIEKTDHDWEHFLRSKCLDDQSFSVRRQIIVNWQKASASVAMLSHDDKLLEAINKARATILQFEQDCQGIKNELQRQKAVEEQ